MNGWRIAEVAQLEVFEDHTGYFCKLCREYAYKPDSIKHASDCPIAILREEEEEEYSRYAGVPRDQRYFNQRG
jgi:hypothetical protein